MSRASLGFLLAVSLVIALFLVSCAPQSADRGRQPADGKPPTATPTPPPTSTPRPTETPTPTPTPAPPEHPAVFDYAFSRGLIRFDPARDQWLVTASQTADRGRQTADFILLPGTFATNDELAAKNPLAPLTLRALDENGQEMTLIYNPQTAEFRIAYSFPALFEGIGTDNPRLIEENLDAIPFIPIQDIQSGLAAQSVLLAMQKDGYQPFSEEAVEWYKKLGGNSLLFVMEKDGKRVMLKPKGNDRTHGITYSNTVEKMTPYWFRTQIGETIYEINAVALLDPLDAQNPQPDEFKILFGIPVVAGSDRVISLSDTEYQIAPTYSTASGNYLMAGWFRIYGDAEYQQNHPLLSQLLGIEGNDAMKSFFERMLIDANTTEPVLGPNNPIIEYILKENGFSQLPPKLQTMIFLFEVGVAQ